MLSDIAIQGMLRDGIYMAAAAALYALLIWMIIRLLGFPFAKIRDKLDENPLAIAVLFGGVSLGVAHIIGAVIH